LNASGDVEVAVVTVNFTVRVEKRNTASVNAASRVVKTVE
jgi:hypothetical protein